MCAIIAISLRTYSSVLGVCKVTVVVAIMCVICYLPEIRPLRSGICVIFGDTPNTVHMFLIYSNNYLSA